MSEKYQYDVAATANEMVNENQLKFEIIAADIGVVFEYMNTNIETGKLDIYMAGVLTANQQTALTAVVVAHQGVGYDSTLNGSLSIVSGLEQAIVGVDWNIMEGVLTTPEFFTTDISEITARIVGQYKGDGGQLCLTEEVEGEIDEEKINPLFEFPDSLGEWKRFKINSNVPPRAGVENLYTTKARLDGAVALSLRYATISMIKTRIIVG